MNVGIVAATREWVAQVVVGLNLCPFARRELEGERIRYAVSEACEPADVLAALHAELMFLLDHPEIETTLLIHPRALNQFEAYNGFLDICDGLLATLDLEGVFQIASFHPEDCFAGCSADSAENYSNRSPFPMLHLLREASVSRAVDAHPDARGIPDTNIEKLRQLGEPSLRAILAQCSGH